MLASPWSGQGQNRNTLDDPDGRNRGAGGGRVGATGAANARRRQLAPEPYSLGHLRVLFQRLIDAQEGKGEGETTVVETLRGKCWIFSLLLFLGEGGMRNRDKLTTGIEQIPGAFIAFPCRDHGLANAWSCLAGLVAVTKLFASARARDGV